MTSPHVLVPSLSLTLPSCPDITTTRSRLAVIRTSAGRVIHAAIAFLRFELSLSERVLEQNDVRVPPGR